MTKIKRSVVDSRHVTSETLVTPSRTSWNLNSQPFYHLRLPSTLLTHSWLNQVYEWPPVCAKLAHEPFRIVPTCAVEENSQRKQLNLADQKVRSVIKFKQVFPVHVVLHHVDWNIQLILRFSESVFTFFYNVIDDFEII